MTPSRLATAAFIGMLCFTPATLPAQILGTSGGAGVIAASPGGDFGKVQTNGIGAYGKLESTLLVIGLAAEVNLIRFGGEDRPGGATTDATTVFGAQVGPRIGFLLGKAGIDLGYYSQFDGLGWGPAISLGLGPLEVGATATFVDGGRWFGLRGGVRF